MTELIDCIHQFEQARSAESSCNSIIWVSCLSNLFNLPSYLANPFSAEDCVDNFSRVRGAAIDIRIVFRYNVRFYITTM